MVGDRLGVIRPGDRIKAHHDPFANTDGLQVCIDAAPGCTVQAGRERRTDG